MKPSVFLPFGGPPGLGSSVSQPTVGGAKMSIPQIAEVARPFITVEKKDLTTTLKTIMAVENVLDVKGKGWKEIVAEEEERFGFKLTAAQIKAVKERYPISGLKAEIEPSQRGSVSFSHTSFGHVRKFLEAL